MPDPVHIPAGKPDLQDWEGGGHGDVKVRLLVDASGGPSSEIAQSLAEIAAGGEEDMHSHDRAQTGFVVEGSGQAVFDGRTLDVAKGDAVFVPAGTPHGWRAGDDGLVVLSTFAADRADEVGTSFGGGA